jgi:hypothetical protein
MEQRRWTPPPGLRVDPKRPACTGRAKRRVAGIRSGHRGSNRTRMTARDDFLCELAGALRGSARRRRRLIDELAGHIDDARRAELAEPQIPAAAERIVLDRLGDPDEIANRWNADQRARQQTQRRRVAALVLAVVAAAALGVTQYAGGTPRPPKRDLVCERLEQPHGMTKSKAGRATYSLARPVFPRCKE